MLTGLAAKFQLMRLRARFESHFLIVGFTRVHTFVTRDSHELTHNLTSSHAQPAIPTKVDLLTPSLHHGDYGPGSTHKAWHRITLCGRGKGRVTKPHQVIRWCTTGPVLPTIFIPRVVAHRYFVVEDVDVVHAATLATNKRRCPTSMPI